MNDNNFHIDYHNILFMYLRRRFNRKERLKLSRKTVKFITFKYFEKSPFANSDDALEIIHELQTLLEDKMKSVISEKSTYYWLHLYRRIGPIASFRNESSVTVWLYRNILETAFFKYGKSYTNSELVYGTAKKPIDISKVASGNYLEAIRQANIGDFLPKNLYGIFLGEFGINELNEIYSLEALAFEYWYTTVCERRLNKGGTLHVQSDYLWVGNDEETEKLMKIYDERGGTIDDLVSRTGSALSNFKATSETVSFLPKYNTQRISTKIFPSHVLFGLPLEIEDSLTQSPIPNFIWLPFDFLYYYTSHEFLENEFENTYNFTLKSFVYICYLVVSEAIFKCIIQEEDSLKVHYTLEMIKRSYKYISSIDNYTDELLVMSKNENFKKFIPAQNDISRNEIKSVLKELTLNRSNLSQINLKTMSPRPLLIPNQMKGSNYIVDYSALLPILLSITDIIGADETKKGHLFEEYVRNKISENSFNIWVSQKELKQKDGSKKEIDVSFIYKNVLFICECKSNKMSLMYGTIGDKKSLDHRKMKMLKALKQVDVKATWLSKSKVGTNYEVPSEIDYIVPLVISPFTEYIWNYSDHLWLNHETPRILLPSEIIDFNYDANIKHILNQGYVHSFLR
ncbi:hypothetical protein CEY16_06385 [Halalkalibacillus sediminis]|uniref:NERD domain-containing protein n=1 Tax=Halalkalibacillus sediminis TaxID=2018042 RepID=A0A2I0QT96_9BACI|nr:hypothetical protein [Halalkalibacillus sediminis]PKR77563.1 hypothetical protein CEY16_06385 [Halalkalibacillus sediminis]